MTTPRANALHRGCTASVQSGFSLVELMVSLAVLLTGIGGVLGMYTTALRATAFSRHATEAAVLGEDKMERLRTLPIADVAPGQDHVDGRGQPDPRGPFTRAWTADQLGNGNDNGDGDGDGVVRIVVTVTWTERGTETRSLVFAALRSR